MVKIIKQIMLFLVLFIFTVLTYNKINNENKNILNVCGWYGVIPQNIITNFEKETGIKVHYDICDNNDTLEAKLLATNGGMYDVVFPSLIPYVSRQSAIGVYQKIDYLKIPNFKNIRQEIIKKIDKMEYFIPYFWGMIGIAVSEEIIRNELSWADVDSYDIILNPEFIKNLYKYGISFPEEFIDIFPQTMLYLGLPPTTKDLKYLEDFIQHFKKIRPYISKFSSTTIISDLLNGSIHIGIGSSDNIYRAIRAGKNIGKKIRCIIPKEGTMLWFDTMCIPKFAKNTENAYKFINYMLRKDVGKAITEHSGIYVSTDDKQKFSNKLILGKVEVTQKDIEFDRIATRVWSQIRLKNFN